MLHPHVFLRRNGLLRPDMVFLKPCGAFLYQHDYLWLLPPPTTDIRSFYLL